MSNMCYEVRHIWPSECKHPSRYHILISQLDTKMPLLPKPGVYVMCMLFYGKDGEEGGRNGSAGSWRPQS